MSGFHRGSTLVITGHASHDSSRHGLAFEHVAHSGEWPMTARSISADDNRASTVNFVHDQSRVDLMPRFLLGRDYPFTREHESRRWRESGHKVHRRRGELHLDLVQSTVQSACGSKHLTEQCAGRFTPNFM
jgi:hypothetical protein